MGLKNYFLARKPHPAHNAPEIIPEKSSSSPVPSAPFSENMELSSPRFPSSRNSSRNSFSGRSNRSTQSSAFLDDIKHEVMVNYLYQQQCSHLWVSDGSGEVEGVLLRKSRNMYMACPPQLGDSAFATACAALNVQVCWISYA